MPFRVHKPLVMLLAGLPASGKTTLLRESLRDRQALFGDGHAAAYLRTRPLPEGSEEQLSVEQRVELGSWINEGDLLLLHIRKARPAQLVVHFDLLWFLRIASYGLAGDRAPDTLQGFAEFLQDDDGVTELFRDALGLHPIRGSRTVVRVVKPAYAVARERWQARSASKGGSDKEPWDQFLHGTLYDRKSTGEGLYERLYANWQRAISEPARSFA